MQFIPLETPEQLNQLTTSEKPQVILKHNTTCSISSGVLNRLHENGGILTGVKAIYVLELPAQRALSDAVAGRFGVPHQSPQILLIQNGRCIYHEWGYDVSAEALEKVLEK